MKRKLDLLQIITNKYTKENFTDLLKNIDECWNKSKMQKYEIIYLILRQ